MFGNLTVGFTGSLRVEGEQKLAAITLRQSHAESGGPLCINYSGSAGVITETATTSRQIQFALKLLV